MFKRPNGNYVFEVVIKGQRYTEETNIRDPVKAKKTEAKWKERKRADVAAQEALQAKTRDARGKRRDMVFIELVNEWWTLKEASLAKPQDYETKLKRLVTWVGPDTMVSDIDDPLVDKLVKRRQQDFDGRIKSREAAAPKLRKDGALRKNASRNEAVLPRRVSNAEVNRSITELLKTLLLYARNTLKLHLPDMPDWSAHILKEKKRVREMSFDEEIAIDSTIREDYAVAIDFLTLTGLRRRQVADLKWSEIDFDHRTISVYEKGDEPHTVAITPMVEAILRAQFEPETGRPYHPEKVFTFVAERSYVNVKNQQSYIKGERYALNYETLGTMWARARKRAGVQNLRLHDLRHTFCSRLLRDAKDLRLVQQAVGHSDIVITQRYSHVLQDAVAQARTRVEMKSAATLAEKKSHQSPTNRAGAA